MTDPITPRDRIESQAQEAARWFVDNPALPKPRNPYTADLPDHMLTWAGAFEVELLRYSAEKAVSA